MTPFDGKGKSRLGGSLGDDAEATPGALGDNPRARIWANAQAPKSPPDARSVPPHSRELSSAGSRLVTVARGTAAAGQHGYGRLLAGATVEFEQARGHIGAHCCVALRSDALA